MVLSTFASPKHRFQYFGIFSTWFSVLPHLQNLVSSTSASPKHGFQHFRIFNTLLSVLPHLQNFVFSTSASSKHGSSTSASPKHRFQYFGIFETWFSVLPHLQNLVSSTSASPKHGFQHTVRMYILHIALAHLHMDAHLHMRFDKNRSMCNALCIIVHYHLYEFSKTAISGQNKPNLAMIFLGLAKLNSSKPQMRN